ncbi:hypothetical protein VFPPC_11592 [Pochonia chlamydosporia 170]|uniref:Uncharacterized protein n=1 Tax=Pochonia chlamydosporia 170 TaxID=1380566 RepID=A0A179EY66_METCM|nr:hypothetical protein VFPPC_11592 [Pochonia chlamydosporia 170]OAQ58137.1 hypothetical protein VFPPC_11592 [Pochonia chlamydosporia 170]
MGFLNIPTRRSNRDGISDRSFRLQDRNPLATASVQSVGGHSPVRRASMQRIRNAIANGESRQQLAGPTKPYFLGMRGDRPSAANSEGRPSLLRSASGRSKVYGATDSEARSLAPSIPSITASTSHSSMRTPGHIDLLDAQGGLKPYDFRARIQAAGVRDYGEDVAERNMGENGVDVRSVAAQEFYEKEQRISTTSSNITHILEADVSTYSGSEAGDLCYVNGSAHSSTRSLSRLSMEPRQEVSGVVAGRSPARNGKAKPSKLALKRTAERRGSHRDHFIATQTSQLQRQHSLSSSRGRSHSARYWISTEQPIAGNTRNGHWEARKLTAESPSRSISPPCVPRYRPGSSLTTMREDDCPGPNSQLERLERGGQVAAVNGSARDAVSILGRDDFQNDNLERINGSDGEDLEYGIPSSSHTHRPAKSSIVPAAPPQYHPDWQSAVQRAVEESLAKLPLAADLKALLELSQSGVPLDDFLQNVPVRHSSLHQGSTISTTSTTDPSDYASSNTGRPHSRHIATTTIDSSARFDLCHMSRSSTHEDKSSASDQYQNSPCLTLVADEGIAIAVASPAPHSQSEMIQSSNESASNHGIMEIEEFEYLTSDYSDVDSFTGKPRQVLDEDETKLFNHEGFGDISNNLPGIVDLREASREY